MDRQDGHDGWTRAERRVSLRAGVEVELAQNVFQFPGVIDQPEDAPAESPDAQGYSEPIHSNSVSGIFSSIAENFRTGQRGSPLSPGVIAGKWAARGRNTKTPNIPTPEKERNVYFSQLKNSKNIQFQSIGGRENGRNGFSLDARIGQEDDDDNTDLVDIDDEALEEHVTEDISARFGEGDFFRLVMLVVIIANSIVIGVQTDLTLAESSSNIFSLIDYIFLSIFMVEIVFKWYYGFWNFWKNAWNYLDVIVVVAALSGPAISFLSNTRILRILRVLRAFRSLRSINQLAGLQNVVQTILESIPDILNISVLLLLVMFIWSVVGVTLFGSVLDEWGDLGKAMFMLWIALTQDGWLTGINDLRAAGQFAAGAIFYASYIIVAPFIFLNMIVALVVANLEKSYKLQKKEQKQRNRQLKTSRSSTQGQKLFQRPVVEMPPGDDPVWKTQIPFEIPDFNQFSKAKLENYFVILSIIEENLVEYIALKDMLSEILIELKLFNSDIPSPEEFEGVEDQQDEELDLEDGDVLSRWIAGSKMK
ncbi:Ion transport protein-domain-containing protein [Cladochytrium replicatum]|nr:Ion transport protein-domain-containing protein [Cladochytrium replicatum]